MEIESVIIVGSGNVAFHLMNWLTMKGIPVSRISSRTFLDGIGQLPSPASLYIIAVSDDAIALVGRNLKERVSDDVMVVHTSGSIPCEVLANCFSCHGVLYPMQTFSRNSSLEYSRIPLFIEAADENATARLERFACRLSATVYRLDSRRRKALHIAAVFACNYLNRMLVHATDVLAECPFGLETLVPLIEETVEKAVAIGPRQAQTGPARRGDIGVLKMHQKSLEHLPDAQQIYTFIARQILDDYGLRPK